MKWNKTIPKDKSQQVFFCTDNRDYIASKDLLVRVELESGHKTFVKALYVHRKKIWLEMDTCQVWGNVTGWMDIDEIL